jgi:hypothetical protein
MFLLEPSVLQRIASPNAGEGTPDASVPHDGNDWLEDGPGCLWSEGEPRITCATCPDGRPAVIRLTCQHTEKPTQGRPRVRDREYLLVQCPGCGRELARTAASDRNG